MLLKFASNNILFYRISFEITVQCVDNTLQETKLKYLTKIMLIYDNVQNFDPGEISPFA